MEKNLNNLGFKTVNNSSKTVRNLINKNNNTHIKSRAGLYEILYLDYKKRYVGETFCSVNKQVTSTKRF